MSLIRPGIRYLISAAIIVATLQSLVFVYVVASRAAVLRNGMEIRLETAPVDPRDLLRGDYVILNYAIARISGDRIIGEWPQTRGRHEIYVRLSPKADSFWDVAEASFEPLPYQAGTAVLKGITSRTGFLSSASSIQVDYGIERYYVPEGEGLEIEHARNDGRISVAARVSDAGVVHIRSLLKDGEPLYEEPLY